MLKEMGLFVLLAGIALPPSGRTFAAHAVPRSVSSEAAKLVAARKALERSPGDPVARNRFLTAFPKDYKGFIRLFGLGAPLYDGYDYIHDLSDLAKAESIRRRVGHILVALCAGAPVRRFVADAPGNLKSVTVKYAAEYPAGFSDVLRQELPSRQYHVIMFVAKMRNFCYYPEYQDAIDRLRQAGKTRLAAEFEQARRRQGGPCSGGPLDPLLRHGKQSSKRGRGEDGN